MTKKELVKIIQKIDYYRQGAAAKLLYVSYPAKACGHFYLRNKSLPHYYKYTIIEYKNDLLKMWIAKKNAKRIVNFYLSKQQHDKNFIKATKIHWDHFCLNPYLDLVKILDKDNFHLWNNNELLSQFKLFSHRYMSVWKNSIFHDAFDVWGEDILEKALNQEKAKLSDEELKLLLSHNQNSSLKQERIDLLAIADFIVKNKKMANVVMSNKINKVKDQFPLLYTKLINHSKKYYWMHNDYSSIERLDEKYFLSEVKKIIKQPIKFKRELREGKLKNNIDFKKRQLLKKKKITKETQNIINLLMTITHWRDERKMYNQMAGNILYKFVQEFSLRTNIDSKLIECLFWQEIIKKIYKLSKKDLQNLSMRKKNGILFFIPQKDKLNLWLGKSGNDTVLSTIKRIKLKDNELKGKSAYPGIVRAKVRLIFKKEDFYKFKSGEVLVAPNTRPEYVPIMRIAKAIISEEGGITCHAAIVSRELKKPSIVGVQGATSILQDGDLVEVDATKGVVKILKKKK